MTQKIRIYNFRHFSNKVLSYRKKVTMRLPRKRESKVGDALKPYVVFNPGIAKITKIKRKKIKDITLKEALADGFSSLEECQNQLMEIHDCDSFQEVDLTYFNPYWNPMLIVDLNKLRAVREYLKKAHFDMAVDKITKEQSEHIITKSLELINDMINENEPAYDIRKDLTDYIKKEETKT